ncbi:DUF58 domain-containing protein [Leptospira sp. GIMC2001]|uniref:DUF58 domain-containing protein n=1 Tax=Leptospira sp. GIMC2001 TaxID=1513297 RepID=UPI00234B29E5|nr:DUF58 domain-containing protein [Leptospira sp. GIMC2001]WCL48227.1 DUF58 domain-containing protein [Leptospira sp. GIMC2001]
MEDASNQSKLELLKKIHLLELISKKNANSVLDGHYKTEIPGKGSEFKEARKYVSGESIRSIDWNMTARLGEPYVKIFDEERERSIIIAIDISASMYTGWQEKSKIEHAIEIASTLAYSAVKSGDRLGYVFFQDKIIEDSRPKVGRRQLYQAISRMVHYRDNQIDGGKTDIRSAIHAIEKQRGNRFVVFVISDFIDLDLPDDLRYLTSHHDLGLLHIYDPFEYSEMKYLRFSMEDPEDSNFQLHGKKNESKNLTEVQEHLKEISIKYGLSWESFSTAMPTRPTLGHYFQKKKRIAR